MISASIRADVIIENLRHPRLEVDELLRSGHVKRWQIVNTHRTQTIAEHMYRVWVITRRIVRDPSFHMAPDLVDWAEEWALIHDQPEVRTGDLATPVKRAMREAVPTEDPIRNIELSLDSHYRDHYLMLKHHYPECLAVVKIADILEAVDFLGSDGAGRHALKVMGDLNGAVVRQVEEAKEAWPQYRWGVIGEVIARMWGEDGPNDGSSS